MIGAARPSKPRRARDERRTSCSFSRTSRSFSASETASGSGTSTSLSPPNLSDKLPKSEERATRTREGGEDAGEGRASCSRFRSLRQPALALLDDHARHALDAARPVVLVVAFAGHVLQVLHVRPHQHVPQKQDVRVGRTLRWKAHRKRRVFTKSKPPSEKATSSCPWDTTRRRVAFAKRKDLKGEPLPSTVPQGYARPLTRRPRLSTRTLLPMTAKGTLSCTHAHARQQYAGRQPAPTRGGRMAPTATLSSRSRRLKSSSSSSSESQSAKR